MPYSKTNKAEISKYNAALSLTEYIIFGNFYKYTKTTYLYMERNLLKYYLFHYLNWLLDIFKYNTIVIMYLLKNIVDIKLKDFSKVIFKIAIS